MARILIVAGGCRGLSLAEALVESGQAVRVTTRTESGRAAIEAAGAECWIGDPGRLATLRGVLDGVAVAIWALGTATGDPVDLRELHGERLAFFATQAIDSTVRGLIYEAAGPQRELLAQGERIVTDVAARNAIPLTVLREDPLDRDAWRVAAFETISGILTSAGRLAP